MAKLHYLAVPLSHFPIRYTHSYPQVVRLLSMVNSKPIVVDFLSSKSLHRLRTSSVRDPLLRAVGLKANSELKVLDATAGFGQDALLMAYHGAKVLMLEREAQMAELLQAGLLIAQNSGELMATAERMSLKVIDAKSYLLNLEMSDYPDVIYLDPMFVHKKSALPNKNMQFLQSISSNADADELLTLALPRALKRIVIKRAINAPPLAGIKPDMCIKSKLLRFDVFLIM
jgi:16S rRNA (guanine1516-N2)-methyltransferase